MPFATASARSIPPTPARPSETGCPPETASPSLPPPAYPGLPLLNSQQVVSVWRQNVAHTKRWESETIPVPVNDKGLYLVEAAHEDLRAYTLVIVTDLTIVTKTAPGRLLAFVVDRPSHAPVADCPLVVWSNKLEIARPHTDPKGLADITVKDANPESTLVLARRGADFAIDSLSNWNLSSDPDRYTVGYVYTDRPVYRPGHTVHWKAILRNQIGLGLPRARRRNRSRSRFRIPKVSLSCARMSPSPPWAQSKATCRSAPAPRSATTPSRSTSARTPKSAGGFYVEEYKKPEYEVRVTPDKRRVLQGSPVQAAISARYFFGEPVANATVKYVVHKSRYWYPLYAADEDDSQDQERRGILRGRRGVGGVRQARRRWQADRLDSHRDR